jgi:SAM-dependent methyltransferase
MIERPLPPGVAAPEYWQSDTRFRPSTHPIPRFFAAQRVAHLARQVDFAAIRGVLDVGCGDGLSTAQFPPTVRTFGVDTSLDMLRRGGVQRSCVADAKRLPFPDNSFDLVNGWEVLHHDPTPEQMVAEMVRVARRQVVLFEPNRFNPGQLLLASLEPEHRLVFRYAPGYLRAVAEAGGLRVTYQAQVGWLFPNRTPDWLFRMLKRLPFAWPVGISTLIVGEKP